MAPCKFCQKVDAVGHDLGEQYAPPRGKQLGADCTGHEELVGPLPLFYIALDHPLPNVSYQLVGVTKKITTGSPPGFGGVVTALNVLSGVPVRIYQHFWTHHAPFVNDKN